MDDDNSQISTSFSSIRTLHPLSADTSIHISTTSLPSSPRSSALPSPPDSPSSDSVSSFPSVSSSFFFSSAAASPPHFAGPSEHGRESTQSLIIPSLTLPSALQRPTSYGQTLGELKLIFLSLKRQEEDFPTQLLSEDNEDVVDVDPWEQSDCGRVLHASTDWVEHRDLHGLERFEPLRNIEVIELPPYDQDDDVPALVAKIESLIHAAFQSVSDILSNAHPPSSLAANLISSPSSPLFTALLLSVPSFPSPFERALIGALSPRIPIIIVPKPCNRHHYQSIPGLASFRPISVAALRNGLFRSPDIISHLRMAATNKFFRWRELNRAVLDIRSSPPGIKFSVVPWNKSRWEFEWETKLANDVSEKLREDAVSQFPCADTGSTFYYLDPLHLRSLVIFSLSFLGPFQSQLRAALGRACMTLAGGVCIGFGVGLFFTA